ncbi:MAG TPA: CAP domain-containing protein [Polyangiaceae bacterium]|nr:CAP domain-containing protein [Polyangiaceae bacterium]
MAIDMKFRGAGSVWLLGVALSACSGSDPGSSSGGGGGSAGQAPSGGSATMTQAGAAEAGGGSGGRVDSSGASGSGGDLNMAGAALGGASAHGGQGGGAGSGGAAGAMNGGSTGSAGATQGTVYPPAAGAGDVATAIAQLNRFRASLGLSVVTLDDASSVGCEGHLQYLIEEAENTGQRGYLEHTENNHDNSHYSAANEQAGKNSDLAWGQSGGPGGTMGQSLGQAVDLWINGVYHRRPLLDPGLTKVGAASIQGYNCFNYNAAGNTTVLKLDHAVLWPADGMTDVPRAFGGNEGPCPTNPADPTASGSCAAAGFIISATYYGWGTNRASALTSVSSVTLTDTTTSAAVPLLTWYADGVSGHDPAHGYMRDEIALVPQAALTPNTTYRVDVDAVVGGSAAPLSWSFTTGTRNQ